MTRLSLLLTSFIFLALSVAPAWAYTSFSANPYFNSNLNGLIIFQGPNSSASWNSTYAGESGVLVLDNGGVGSQHFIYPSSSSVPVQYPSSPSDLYSSGAANILIPANEEGIVVLRYRLNNSLQTPPPLLAVFPAGDTLLNPLNMTYMSTAQNIWENYSLIIPASASPQSVVVIATFTSDNLPTEIDVDEFSFFTYDSTGTSLGWGNAATESLALCGDTNGQFIYTTNNQTELLLDPSTIDGFSCYGALLGSLSFSRRYTEYGTWNNSNYQSVMTTRDNLDILSQGVNVYYQNSAPGDALVMIEGLTLTKATKLTVFDSNDASFLCSAPGGAPYCCMEFNDIHQSLTNLTGLAFDNPNALRQTFNLCSGTCTNSVMQYQNTTTPAGSEFALARGTGYYTTPWVPLYQNSQLLCTAESICSVSTDTESFQNSDCSLSAPQYCGSCGCNANLTGCDFPSQVGTVCDFTDPALERVITYVGDCSSAAPTYESCPSGTVCGTFTEPQPPSNQTDVAHLILPGPYWTAACINETTSQEILCYNSTGSEVNCSVISNPSNLVYCQDQNGNTVLCSSFNEFQSFALSVGAIFSQNFGYDLGVSESITSLLLSLIVGLAAMFIVIFSGDDKGFLELFGLSFIAMLGMFTLALWFPGWLFVLLLIFDGLLISGVIGDLVK